MTSCCDEKQPAPNKAALSIALVGNPNCGKTTLFNALTGAKQHVGNWPGVTVERKSGYFTAQSTTVEVVDLPGIYSLIMASDTAAIDERIACDFILHPQSDVLVNIVDASNLERHLYLTTQLIEMGVPLILALNMMDVARARQIHIDVAKLSQTLGCPVVVLEASKGCGVSELKRAIVAYQSSCCMAPKQFAYPEAIQQAIQTLALPSHWLAVHLLEEDVYVRNHVSSAVLEEVAVQQKLIQQTHQEDADILIADTRYHFIQQVIQHGISQGTDIKTSWTSRIDSIVLNRLLGIPIFLSMMYLLFFFSLNIGGAFQDFFDIGSQTIFVDGFAYWLTNHGAPAWLTVLLANGVGKGINTTVTFIPVIGSLFLFLALLEDSGYMARAAFVIDRFMRALGLPGKAFVPMIVGFGCNVPAIMAARTLDNKRDRILTIMMAPFMSCGARLAIYSVFITAFFPHGGQNVVFALYLIGIFMAVITGFMLRQTLLKGDPSPLVMELPPYHLPRFKALCLHAWQRLKGFVFRAGKLIVPICILIGVLNTLNLDGTMNTGDGDAHSLLSTVGQWVTPIFAPMGLHTDNWPATVGLVTGILAKEVVVGTLN
ncbi:MAG: Fe(2+) transporter permease subunit FeoB, partial [Gammaproteobacteria bacterium]